MYAVDLFAQVTGAPELFYKSAQSEIARSTCFVGCRKRRVKLNKYLINCVSK